MAPAPAATGEKLAEIHRSAAQTRVIDAALELFAQHGVNGTSLQMIADHIGVTKAAVYHQYKSKDEIVIAAVEVELAKVEAVLDAAEQEKSRARARAAVLKVVIDLAVERRTMVSAVQHDPVVVRLLAKHAPFRQLMTRLADALLGGDTSAASRLRVAMVSAAIGGAVMQPLVADIDDATLRTQILKLSLDLLDPPG